MFQFNLLTVSSKSLLLLTAEETKVGERNVKDLLFGAHPKALIQWAEVEIIIGGKWSTHTAHQVFYPLLSLIKGFRTVFVDPLLIYTLLPGLHFATKIKILLWMKTPLWCAMVCCIVLKCLSAHTVLCDDCRGLFADISRLRLRNCTR